MRQLLGCDNCLCLLQSWVGGCVHLYSLANLKLDQSASRPGQDSRGHVGVRGGTPGGLVNVEGKRDKCLSACVFANEHRAHQLATGDLWVR